MREALAQVRRELGPDAAVLGTREVHSRRVFGLLSGPSEIEVTASTDVNVPSRFSEEPAPPPHDPTPLCLPPNDSPTCSGPKSSDVECQIERLHRMVEELCQRQQSSASVTADQTLPEGLRHVMDELVERDVDLRAARELIERLRGHVAPMELTQPDLLRSRLVRMIADDLHIAGPIDATAGQRRLVALVGPTGVGKTTTIAKLAANFRLGQQLRVGLITVDTYRIAAVEQLRTYADIIDLPMHVVSTPREMGQAVDRTKNLDLVLIDTAGRSPRDDVKIRELRAFITEAAADEVHLVLSATASSRVLRQTVERFAAVEPNRLILTKTDESPGLGATLPVLQRGELPLSYLTHGQNVPEDIAPAHARGVAEMIVRGPMQ